MKYFKSYVASFYYNETVLPSVINLCNLIKEYSFILKPFRGKDEKVEAILSSSGFILYPTVKKTTLFYESATDCFFKILHPLTLKHKISFLFKDRIRAIYNLSEYLLSKGIKVPQIMAYGLLKSNRLFFVMRRIEGKSLYDILLREKKTIPKEMYLKIVDKVAEVHSLGHWLGDAHLSHIFVNASGVSGFIDIDSIKKNRPFRLKNLAKDLAGLNHPELPVTEAEKMKLLNYYMNKIDIRKREIFLRLLKQYTERRWKE
jgi:aminoglycoside phosphotransferase